MLYQQKLLKTLKALAEKKKGAVSSNDISFTREIVCYEVVSRASIAELSVSVFINAKRMQDDNFTDTEEVEAALQAFEKNGFEIDSTGDISYSETLGSKYLDVELNGSIYQANKIDGLNIEDIVQFKLSPQHEVKRLHKAKFKME